MSWDAVTAIATLVSMVAFCATALFVWRQVQHMEDNRYLAITNELFAIWESRDFMDAQLWLLHRLEERTWEEFVRAHRADYGEAAFHRVGSFYDRVGTLVRLRMINEQEILSTLGPYAIAVWQKMEPLVREARAIEHSLLFDDFEYLIPACVRCYVPALGTQAHVNPFSLLQPADQISGEELRERLRGGPPVTLLDVRMAHQVQEEPAPYPDIVTIPADQLVRRFRELARDHEVIAFCTCPEEASSARAALFLNEQGYRARAVVGGLGAVRAAVGTPEGEPG